MEINDGGTFKLGSKLVKLKKVSTLLIKIKEFQSVYITLYVQKSDFKDLTLFGKYHFCSTNIENL